MFLTTFSAILIIFSVILLSIFIKDLVEFVKARNNYDIEDQDEQLWEHMSKSVLMFFVVIFMFLIHLRTY